MSVEVQWQIIQMDNETVGCTDTLTSDRLCPLPCVSAKPQSQAQVFFSIKSLLFVSLVFFFFHLTCESSNTEMHNNVHRMFCQFLKVTREMCSENECNHLTSHCFDTIFKKRTKKVRSQSCEHVKKNHSQVL